MLKRVREGPRFPCDETHTRTSAVPEENRARRGHPPNPRAISRAELACQSAYSLEGLAERIGLFGGRLFRDRTALTADRNQR